MEAILDEQATSVPLVTVAEGEGAPEIRTV
jgi:hypothetical protein